MAHAEHANINNFTYFSKKNIKKKKRLALEERNLEMFAWNALMFFFLFLQVSSRAVVCGLHLAAGTSSLEQRDFRWL